MVNRFQSGDFHVINGVLRTAHSLFKRYKTWLWLSYSCLQIKLLCCAVIGFWLTLSLVYQLLLKITWIFLSLLGTVMSLNQTNCGQRSNLSLMHLHYPWPISLRYSFVLTFESPQKHFHLQFKHTLSTVRLWFLDYYFEG